MYNLVVNKKQTLGDDVVRYKKMFRQCISAADAIAMRNTLSELKKEDCEVVNNGSEIRSLSFDIKTDPKTRDGEYKIQYIAGDMSTLRLYKLIRQHDEYLTVSMPVSEKQCRRILSGDTEWMADSRVQLFRIFYADLKKHNAKPKKVTAYKNYLYTFENGKCAVSLKSGICGSFDCKCFLESDPSMVTLFGNTVAEIKWNDELPEYMYNIMQTVSVCAANQ